MKVTLAIVKALIDRAMPKIEVGVEDLEDTQTSKDTYIKYVGVGKQGKDGKDGKSIKGKDGKDGTNGRDGTDGKSIKGKDGKDGTNGKDGKSTNGKDGKDGTDGKNGTDGKSIKGDTGKGITSIRVNEKNMLVVTYDDGDMTIAGTVSVTREGTSIIPPTGAPVGSFGVVGTKVSEAGELIIVGAWGKEFNTGFTSGAGSLQSTFETVNKNLKAYGFVLNYTGTSLTSIIYTKGSSVITKTFGYTGELLTSITLSGDLPTGIQTIKTLQYTDSTLNGAVYS
tara:strand:- start:130 stop:972 length:843 start_codon:yes stop_codon:yes gene_type:complete